MTIPVEDYRGAGVEYGFPTTSCIIPRPQLICAASTWMQGRLSGPILEEVATRN